MEERRYLIRAEEASRQEGQFSHPLNPDSLLNVIMLSRITGMERVGVSLGRISSGHESFIYHTQHSEEEWLYIISGRGVAEIHGAEHEVGPGDFMGFPTPSVAHNLKNPFEEDLVYLMGGENRSIEIADFPKLGKRLVRTEGRVEVYDVESASSFEAPE